MPMGLVTEPTGKQGPTDLACPLSADKGQPVQIRHSSQEWSYSSKAPSCRQDMTSPCRTLCGDISGTHEKRVR